MLPQVASSDTQFTAKDIDMKAISNRQQPKCKQKQRKTPNQIIQEHQLKVEKFNPNFWN